MEVTPLRGPLSGSVAKESCSRGNLRNIEGCHDSIALKRDVLAHGLRKRVGSADPVDQAVRAIECLRIDAAKRLQHTL